MRVSYVDTGGSEFQAEGTSSAKALRLQLFVFYEEQWGSV